MTYELVLYALADPTRRRLLKRLRRRPSSVGALARYLQVSQPAVSQHLAVLRDARLVQREAAGTTRLYRPDLTGVAALRNYLDQMWTDVLAAYADSFNQEPSDD